MQKQPAIYIMTNKPHGVLYIGVTSNLIKRVYEHRQHAVRGFTDKYGCEMLVYYELHVDMENAIKREKRLKKYTREAKIKLIEQMNVSWRDLYSEIIQ